MKKNVSAKIIGKWIRKGWFFEKAMLSLEFINGDLDPRYYDMPIKRAEWYSVNIGDYIVVVMKLDEDNNGWYPETYYK